MCSFPEVRLLGPDKEMIGIMSTDEAQDRADELNVDLVVISEDAQPPVARLMDYSKFKFEQGKAQRAAKAKQKAAVQKLKELKMRVNIEDHDYQGMRHWVSPSQHSR